MKIAIAGDHAGFPLKRLLQDILAREGHHLVDLGTHDETPSDYPDVARALGKAIVSGQAERGILVCGSGIGACVAVNKIRGIRGGVAHDIYSAHQGVEHDDMNVLCLGARVIGSAPAVEIVHSFLAARFTKEERHQRRLNKILDIERNQE